MSGGTSFGEETGTRFRLTFACDPAVLSAVLDRIEAACAGLGTHE